MVGGSTVCCGDEWDFCLLGPEPIFVEFRYPQANTHIGFPDAEPNMGRCEVECDRAQTGAVFMPGLMMLVSISWKQ